MSYIGRVNIKNVLFLTSNKKDSHDNVWEESREIDDFSGWLNSLHDDEKDNDPGKDQAEQHPVPDASKVSDATRDSQRGPVPEVLRFWGQVALRDDGGGVQGLVDDLHGTFGPRERQLKWGVKDGHEAFLVVALSFLFSQFYIQQLDYSFLLKARLCMIN